MKFDGAEFCAERWRRRSKKEGKYIVCYLGIFKLGAPLMVVLVYFAQRVGTYLLRKKLPTSTSTSNIVLIDVAPSTFTNGPK